MDRESEEKTVMVYNFEYSEKTLKIDGDFQDSVAGFFRDGFNVETSFILLDIAKETVPS